MLPLAALVRKSERFNGKSVLVKVACSAAGSNCNGILKLTTPRPWSSTASGAPSRLVPVTKHETVAAGKTATVSVALDARERRALKSAGKLKVTGGPITEASGPGRAQLTTASRSRSSSRSRSATSRTRRRPSPARPVAQQAHGAGEQRALEAAIPRVSPRRPSRGRSPGVYARSARRRRSRSPARTCRPSGCTSRCCLRRRRRL